MNIYVMTRNGHNELNGILMHDKVGEEDENGQLELDSNSSNNVEPQTIVDLKISLNLVARIMSQRTLKLLGEVLDTEVIVIIDLSTTNNSYQKTMQKLRLTDRAGPEICEALVEISL